MRLHNRQIKAAFWTDTDLLRNLDRDGRMFYLGLIQLADDSGCLEDDVLAFKVHLYPADMDVDLDFIQRYRDKLVEMGKAIPYTAGGKRCLYLKNFHKHQTLKNCPAPDVPLPPWITWEPFKSNDRSGKYIIDADVLTEFLQSSYDCLTNNLQPSSNLTKPNLTKPEPNLTAGNKHMCADAHECDNAQTEKTAKTSKSKSKSKNEYTPEFEEFWQYYPRTKEKARAFKAWNARVRDGTPPEHMITAAQNYAKECQMLGTEERFIKLAATFLGPSVPFEDYINWIPPEQIKQNNRKMPKGMLTIKKMLAKESECCDTF